MNSVNTKVIERISSICEKHPFEEKYLIIPSFRMRGQVRKYLNDHGIQAINLNIVSPGSIALEWAEAEILKRGATVLSYNDVADIMGEVLANLKERELLKFLKDSMITPGLNRTISGGINELRKNRIKQGNTELSRLENQGKRDDIEQILNSYEELLKKNNYLDHADILEIALAGLTDKKKGKGAPGYILPGVRPAYLEKELLSFILGEETQEEDSESMAYRRDGWEGSLEFTKAYGEYNEVKEVIRNIIVGDLSLDSCLVVTTVDEPYAQLFYQILQTYLPGPGIANARTELPITFGMGLPITFSNPGKLALAILKWVKYGYRAHDLVSIFSGGSINLKTVDDDTADVPDGSGNNAASDGAEAPDAQTLIRIIKDSNLKWQRKTYSKTLNTHRQYLERRVFESVTDPQLKKRYEKRLSALGWLDKTLENHMFSNLPEEDEKGRIDSDLLYKGIGEIIKKFKKILGALDAGAYEAILDTFRGSLKTEPVPVAEAVDIVIDRIKQIRILVSDPEPGKLHVTNFRMAGFIERDNTFLLGLDAGRYPGRAVEDPFLLDEERKAVAKDLLPASEEIIEEKIRNMNRFLNSVRGKLRLSYSCFDNVDLREQYPSSLYIDLLETLGVHEKVAGFIVGDRVNSIDENDEWINMAADNEPFHEECINSKLSMIHPEFAFLRESINGEKACPGIISIPDPTAVDPRINRKVQSASVLSDYLNCRYKYLLKYIMYLKEYRERELDTIGWMDPLESGSLFHEILEKFHNEAIKDPGIRKDENLAIDTITGIAAETISRYEQDLPTGSAFYTAAKKEGILADCKIYAAGEVEKYELYEPLYTEYRFGSDGELVLPLNEEETIRVAGAVDRIDRFKNREELRIVDYKTGSDYSYRILDEKGAPPLNHKSLQPALYYMALKELGIGRVREAAYHFVNSKGDYKERIIEFYAGAEEKYKEGLRDIFDAMATGDFQPLFDEKSICRFCGYMEICVQSLQLDEFPENELAEEAGK